MTDWAQEGFLDKLEGDARAQRVELLDWLESRGADLDLLTTARDDGLLPFVAAERVLTRDAERFTIEEVAQQGIDVVFMEKLRRTQGLRTDAEARFAAFELDIARVVDAYRQGLGDEAVLDIGRVLGRGLGQTAQVMRSALIERVVEPGLTELELAQRFAAAVELAVPNLGRMVELTLRLHLRNMLRTEAADALARITGGAPGSREIVVGFADLVGFTRMGEEVDPEDLGAVADRLAVVASDVVNAPVRIVKTIGDAVMLVAEETSAASDMVASGLDILEALEAEGPDFPQVRVGLATGAASARGGDWFGRPVNLADRVCSAARAGSVLVTEEVHDASAGEFQWSFAGERRLKGVSAPVKLFRARRPAEAS